MCNIKVSISRTESQYKCWYYSKAIEDGNEDRLKEMMPDHLPQDIQKLYDLAHDL